MRAEHRASRSPQHMVVGLGMLLLAAGDPCAARSPQEPASQASNPPSSPPVTAEVSSHDAEPTFKFKAERNLVVVRAVVRDSNGHAVGDLQQDDFRLFDNGKPQAITHFSIEKVSPGLRTSIPTTTRRATAEATTAESSPPASLPQRYLALYFDDVHMVFEDVARTREAAERYLKSALTAGDRVGIFTASGQNVVDFTDDRDQLHDGLARLFPRPIIPRQENDCPQILDYQAYLIVHQRDSYALAIATEEAFHCNCEMMPNPPPSCRIQAEGQAEAKAMQVLHSFETESEYALQGLSRLLRRIAYVPGQRSVVLVSPGFLTLTQGVEVNEITDQALRANVVISALDSQGLYATVPLGDATQRPVVIARRPDLEGHKVLIQVDGIKRSEEVLQQLAADTGGTFFHNSNDFDKGLREVGALPEVYYVLAFSPQNLKVDGRFHVLKVTLAHPAHLAVVARRGYFAPTKAVDHAAQASEEIEQAVFSQDELNELPIEIHTQFFKLDNVAAKLSVVTHLDLRFFHFRKEQGRNLNNVTVVTALFDRSGTYVSGKQKLIEFRLRDASLAKLSQSGVSMKTSFDVKPGTYLVRSVVRDTEGSRISALNRSVEIPH